MPAISVLQNIYDFAGSGKEHVRAAKEARLIFSLLMTLSLLIHLSINKVSGNAMLCSDPRLTDGAALYCPLERFQELQKSLVSNAYDAL